ncbi:MAG: tRNA pseudouridine(55) synthase TruB [Acidobacteriota bacterium]
MPDGILVVDKPKGPTSHDVVYSVRKLLKEKVGHTGTLDPLATGVLPLTLGQATRLTRFFQASDKEYTATIRLGQTTDTLDAEGQITSQKPVPPISRQAADEVLSGFRGEIQQLPPMFSAVKVGGRKLYELARKSQQADRPLRSVFIERLEWVEQHPESWVLSLQCSSGTYVRALAHDIGQVLACGAFLAELRRTRSGPFDLSRAVTLERLASDWRSSLYPLEELLPELPRVDLDDRSAQLVRKGNGIRLEGAAEAQMYRLFHEDKLIALAQSDQSRLQPKVVLSSHQNEGSR